MSKIHISDLAFKHIEAFIEEHWDRGATTDEELAPIAVTVVIKNAQSFFETFAVFPFIYEPVHEFVAIGIINDADPEQPIELKLRMVLQQEDMYVQAPEECPIDEMYDVRKVIAESHLPENQ